MAWVEIKDFPEYEIHPKDGVRKKGKEKTLKARTWLGYPKVTLMKGKKKFERRIHRLVGEHFVDNPLNLPILNHKDSDRSNHRVDNLEWVDNSGNQLHRWKTQKQGMKKMKYEQEYGLKKVAELTTGYEIKLKNFIESALKDELSASIMYAKASNELVGIGSQEVSEELMNHSKEEYGHFNQLLAFASAHDILKDIKFTIDYSVVDFSGISNSNEVMKKVQELEEKAIRDYEMMAKCAFKNGDLETTSFMREIMSDEIKHFDDLAYINGEKRKFRGLSLISSHLI